MFCMHRNNYIDSIIPNLNNHVNECQCSGASRGYFSLELMETVWWFDSIEREAKEKCDNSKWWLNIPEAKPFLKEEIARCKMDLIEADRIDGIIEDIIYRKCSKENEEILSGWLKTVYAEPLRKGREETIKRNAFLLSDGAKKQTLDVERARRYPISEMIKFNRAGKGRCVWCNDKDGDDLHYYRGQNRVYCFSCNKAGDAIDVAMEVFKLGFPEAVKKLS